jgi:hypothetical protein
MGSLFSKKASVVNDAINTDPDKSMLRIIEIFIETCIQYDPCAFVPTQLIENAWVEFCRLNCVSCEGMGDVGKYIAKLLWAKGKDKISYEGVSRMILGVRLAQWPGPLAEPNSSSDDRSYGR